MKRVPLLALLSVVASLCHAAPTNNAPTPASVLAEMDRVNTWQMANLVPRRQWWDWTYGAYLAGWKALADLSPDPRHYDGLTNFCWKLNWALGPRVYHADDHCVGQTYTELYQIERLPAMIAPLQQRFDHILATPPENPDDLDFTKPKAGDKWSWCDALFMGPTVWTRLYAVTGDRRYLDFGVREWWKAYDYLYDKEEHLFYRDSNFFAKREANGKKIFWSRGNGWVVAGLARVLQYLPADHPDRARFVTLFRDMCTKLAAVQGEDGLWRPSLLDPGSYPMSETSGSGFFTYALMWGVNQGLLDRKTFTPAALKGWQGLVSHIQPSGMLGSVQPIGYDPRKVKDTDTEVYGTGAFLLAGSEVYRWALLQSAPSARVTVVNALDEPRFREVVGVRLASLPPALRKAKPGQLGVLPEAAARWVDSQLFDSDDDGTPDTLLFQADFPGKGSAAFTVVVRPADLKVPAPVNRVFARFVPERLDDFAWETDRIAHRMYGQALIAAEKNISSGADVWLKRTRGLVVDHFYKTGDYHKDHGLGVDCYTVGTSRGTGGTGVLADNKLWVSRNFTSWKVLANGPLRAVFELTFDAWDAGGRKVSEVKRITADAGSNLHRVRSRFTSPSPKPITAAVAFVEAGWSGRGQRSVDAAALPVVDAAGAAPGAGADSKTGVSWVADWQPNPADNGQTGVAVLLPGGKRVKLDGHWALSADVVPGKPFVYYFGAGWSKADHPEAKAWFDHVARAARALESPLMVQVAK